ncbi:MAG: hypothetical protein AAGL98_11265, partial [Planctomycetota bacterium]
FLMARDWKAAWVACATAGLFALLSLGLAGPELHWAMLEQLRLVNSFLFVGNINHGLETILVHFADPLASVPAQEGGMFSIRASEAWANAITKVLLLAGTAATWWATRHAEKPQALQLLAMTNLVILCGPLGWSHYFVASLVLLPALFARLSPRIGFVLFMITAFLLGQPLSLLLLDIPVPDLYVAWIGAAWLLAIFGLTLASARPRNADSA